eukprot:scaffold269471_cov36-Prasinocladus_malaysianus.AAC.2
MAHMYVRISNGGRSRTMFGCESLVAAVEKIDGTFYASGSCACEYEYEYGHPGAQSLIELPPISKKSHRHDETTVINSRRCNKRLACAGSDKCGRKPRWDAARHAAVMCVLSVRVKVQRTEWPGRKGSIVAGLCRKMCLKLAFADVTTRRYFGLATAAVVGFADLT